MGPIIKKLPGAHLIAARGSPKQNKEYCSKGDDVIERGECPQQGARTDLLQIKEMIDNGCNMLDIFDADFATAIKFHKSFEKYAALKQESRNDRCYIEWRWGETGTGKTRYVYDKHGRDNVYMKSGTKWWDGYSAGKVILIDDFDGAWPYRDLLRLLDRYPYTGETKGSHVVINSPYIYITCEHHPEFFWKGNELKQILRRIDLVKHVFEIEN